MKFIRLALYLIFVATSVCAQVPGNPNIDTNYRTYTDAIIDLTEPLRANSACPGLPNDLGPMQIEDGFAELSFELQQLCTPLSNGSSGGTLSGGFSEPFSTRTFLPFTVNTTRPAPPRPVADSADQPVLSFGSVGNALGFLEDAPKSLSGGITGDDHWMSFGLEVIDYNLGNSDFETGRSGNGFRGAFVLGRRLTNSSYIGVGFSYEKVDADLNFNSFLSEEAFVARGPVLVAEATASVEEFCRNLDRGSEDAETLQLNAFYAGNLSQNTTFQVFGDVKRTSVDTSSPLCFFQIYDSAANDTVFAGHLSGSPKATSVTFGAQAERGWTFRNTRLLLRGRAEATNRWVDEYTQTERSVDASSPPSNEAGAISVVDTGLALKYDDRHTFTVSTELGLRGIWNTGGPQNPGTFWIDAAYQHVFGDLDERVTAQFAGDDRSTPTRFTFQGNPIPNNRITIGTGFDYVFSDRLASSFYVSGSFTDLSETYRLGAALRWRF